MDSNPSSEEGVQLCSLGAPVDPALALESGTLSSEQKHASLEAPPSSVVRIQLQEDDDENNAAHSPADKPKDNHHRHHHHHGTHTKCASRSPSRRIPALAWSNVIKRVPNTAITILRDVSGEIYEGEMIALMGASGSGKTTLLNCLSGRTGLIDHGTVDIFGEVATKNGFRRLSTYVTQDDVLPEALTAEEVFDFAARMRLNISPEERKRVVRKVLAQLELTAKKDIIVGAPGQHTGLSGGQRKRVNIGQGLVTDPKIMFLDEPTSGLDSRVAFSVVKMLQGLAHKHRKAVVVTIHQPSPQTFALFDKVMFLAEGRVAYFGPVTEVAGFFARHGYVPEPGINPADFYIETLSTVKKNAQLEVSKSEACPDDVDDGCDACDGDDGEGYGNGDKKGKSQDEAKQAAAAAAAAATTTSSAGVATAAAAAASIGAIVASEERTISSGHPQQAREVAARLDEMEKGGVSASASEGMSSINKLVKAYRAEKNIPDIVGPEKPFRMEDSAGAKKFPVSFWEQIRALFSRAMKTQVRTPMLVKARVVQTIFIGLLVGIIYLNIGYSQASVQNRTGVLFLVLVNTFILSTIGVLFTFPAERTVVLRDQESGLYPISAYFLTKINTDLPFQILFPSLYVTILYFMVDFKNTAEAFFVFLVVAVLVSNVGASLGFLMSGATGSVAVSLSLAPMTFLPLMLFSGFLVNLETVTWALRWIAYINPMRYGFSAIMQSEFTGLVFTCPTGAPPNACPWKTGDQVLSQYDLGNLTTWENVAVLVGFLVALRILGVLALRWSISREIAKRI